MVTGLSGGPTPEQGAETLARLLDYARELSRFAPLPGGVLALVGPDGVLAQGAFGFADLERGTPMTVDHVFQIGSISKVFTSLVVVGLADEGLLSLDEPVTRSLPWLVVGSDGDEPTLRELLSHMGGLVMGADFPPDELAQAWALRSRVVAPRPRRFHYSNIGFMLLGLAASARTGLPLAELVSRRLLGPLGMTRSVAAITEEERSVLAVGYAPAREDRPWAPGDALAPAAWPTISSGDGNVAATASDLGQLARLLLGDGVVSGTSVVPASTIDQVRTPTAVGGEPTPPYPPLASPESSTYGLGINIERLDGHELLTHGGGMVGYSTFLLVDRTARFGVVVLTNANGDNLHAQLLARAAHADLRARVSGRPEPELPRTDPRARAEDLPPAVAGLLGRALHSEGLGSALIVDRAPDGSLEVSYAGQTGVLFRTLTGRFVTDHPDLRTFHLDPAEEPPAWTHGPSTLTATGDASDVQPSADSLLSASWGALVGHYRSYSPWYPHLRILARDGRLLLAAPGGVEAPAEEEELVEDSPGVFRVGADPWFPSRLTVGHDVEGFAVAVNFDGCPYSRTFTP